MKLLLFMAFLAGSFVMSFAQNEKKFSAGTRMSLRHTMGRGQPLKQPGTSVLLQSPLP